MMQCGNIAFSLASGIYAR